VARDGLPGQHHFLITFDTTRADRLGAYGGRAITPTVDALAAEGVLFEQAIAPAPLTESSHLAILSGTALHRTGLYSNGTVLGHRPDLLSHAFQEAGYRTGAVVSGFPLHGKYGWTQGFDFYEDDFGPVPGLHRLSLMRAWDQLRLPGNTLRERPGAQTLKRAEAFLNRHKEGPFFLWVHFFDPHAPYEVSEEELAAAPRDGEALDLPAYWPPLHRNITSTDWLTRAYEGEISATDALLGELLEGLGEAVRSRTLVAFTSDHGESLDQHNSLFDHGDFLYDASLHIPLILSGPGVPRGKRVACQVSGIDLAPTLRALTGLSPLQNPAGAGQNLAPFAEDCIDRPVHSATVAARHVAAPPLDHALRLPVDYGDEAGVRMSKFIQHGAGGEHLFDLVVDPEEELNVVEAFPAAAGRLRAMLSLLLKGASEVAQPESDPATLEALRALGYVQ
jgi:arylsulfatase A-like enzyme